MKEHFMRQNTGAARGVGNPERTEWAVWADRDRRLDCRRIRTYVPWQCPPCRGPALSTHRSILGYSMMAAPGYRPRQGPELPSRLTVRPCLATRSRPCRIWLNRLRPPKAHSIRTSAWHGRAA